VHSLAEKCNRILEEEVPSFFSTLSALGRELYYPAGILTQTREAREKAHRLNATIGIATVEGEPAFLPCIREHLPLLSPRESFDYAPTCGFPALRETWRSHLMEANPLLEGKSLSLPVVTSGLTHALSICADLFCDPGDPVLLPDPMWGNYRMIFGTRRGAEIITYRLFDKRFRLNLEGLASILSGLGGRSKALLVLNFPHNPSGYTPTVKEAHRLADILEGATSSGTSLVVICDDAYFGLFYEDDVFQQSLFSLLADRVHGLFAVKVDGPTKEDYVWGFRVGFLTFSIPGASEATYRALEDKVGGIIRATVSTGCTPSQSILLRAFSSPHYRLEKEERVRMMRERYQAARKALEAGHYDKRFLPYPFNSGYFLTVKLLEAAAEPVRRLLLEKYGVGLVSVGEEDIRIAYSCLEAGEIKELFDILYDAAGEAASAGGNVDEGSQNRRREEEEQ
jgi:aspartate/methionine/tyrosine aminotransferase